jgi:hypothetical protein
MIVFFLTPTANCRRRAVQEEHANASTSCHQKSVHNMPTIELLIKAHNSHSSRSIDQNHCINMKIQWCILFLFYSGGSAFILPSPSSSFLSTTDTTHNPGIRRSPITITPSQQQQQQQQQQQSWQLNGIRGFRSWFESQFPNAMDTIEHSHKKKQSEAFHHVLVDMNQLLHIVLRRSRSEGHALTLLIQELDKCMEIASPIRSIVLAFDGPPAAAKLATQRRRRLGTVIRADRKMARMELLKSRGVLQYKKKSHEKRKDKAEKEEETLKITPGTEFMDRAHEAVLYWAWQRLENPQGKLANCRVYISPSTVPGEGEVKLLDWLIQAGSDERIGRVMKMGNLEMESHRRLVKPGESVAILGGDSDLVLEGLVIPPTITHNVFVILPSTGKTSYVVSLWETTLTLGKYLGKKYDPTDIMRVRTDLVLLLIMNGNDYLPKLRGSAGFNKLFHSYLRLLREWIKDGDDNDKEEGEMKNTMAHRPYLVNPDTLEFNLPFCLAYFQMLASSAPKQLAQPSDMIPNGQSITPLSQLYSMVDAGFLPSPAEFERVQSSQNDSGKELLRLTLGPKHKKIQFDIAHGISAEPGLKKAKQTLANIALENLLGKDYFDMNDLLDGDASNTDADDFDFGSNSGGAYPWEIAVPAASSVEEYLRGLLWNLSTYQDGVCSDYGYNYGRRMSPTAEEIVSYFEVAQKDGKNVDREALLGNSFVTPLSAGLSCLAALPSQVANLVPEPYRQLSTDGTVEDIFGSCMDPDNNVFNMQRFKDLCTDAVGGKTVKPVRRRGPQRKSNLRKVMTGDTFWTVIRRVQTPLVHPFEPPPPFSGRLSYLRPNSRIKATHIMASDRPRWLREEIPGRNGKNQSKKTGESEPSKEGKHSDMGKLLVNALGDDTTLENVGYKMVYQSKEVVIEAEKRKKTNVIAATGEKTPLDKKNSSSRSFERELMQYEMKRMKEYGLKPPEISRNSADGFNALQCLQQLYDADLICELLWEYNMPSKTKYASEYPDFYEEVKVSISILDDEPFRISQDRNSKLFSRKLVKHTLASIIMDQLFRDKDEWHKKNVKEMKYILTPTPKANIVNEDANALQCLHHLRDARLVEVSWDFHDHSETTEIVRLSVNGNGINLVLEEIRDVYQHSKATLKHRLAGEAMEKLMSVIGKDWRSMSISEIRDCISLYIE